ncbi:hypothetical protein GCM10020001_099510 [Nonomuraea salmonea]
MRLSRKLKLLCAALVPMLALTACSGGGGQAGADGGEQVKITVWSWDGTVEQAVPGFQAAHPNIKVEVVNAGSSQDEYKALDNAIQAGSGVPDLVMFEYFAVPYFAVPGKLADLGELGADKLKADYVPAAWNDVTVNGKVYALPSDYGPSAMFYNEATLKKAGIDEPPRPRGTRTTRRPRRSASSATTTTSPRTPATSSSCSRSSGRPAAARSRWTAPRCTSTSPTPAPPRPWPSGRRCWTRA